MILKITVNLENPTAEELDKVGRGLAEVLKNYSFDIYGSDEDDYEEDDQDEEEDDYEEDDDGEEDFYDDEDEE